MSVSPDSTRVGIEVCSDRLHAAAIDAAGNLALTRTVSVADSGDRLDELKALIKAFTEEAGGRSLGE